MEYINITISNRKLVSNNIDKDTLFAFLGQFVAKILKNVDKVIHGSHLGHHLEYINFAKGGDIRSAGSLIHTPHR